jgi:YVTN family beta-propeller protein
VGDRSVWVAYGDSTLARVVPRPVRVAGATFAGASPAGVAVGGGSIWVVNSGDGTVTRFSPAKYEGGASGRPIRVGRHPAGIAYGAGAVWVADPGDDAVTRIDPLTNSTSKIATGAGPTAVTVGGGLVWVANTAAGTVSRIDPVSNEVSATIKVGNSPAGLVFANDSLWVAVTGS